jgi:hypothetical protein
VAGFSLLPLLAQAQDAALEACRVANLQRAEELLQALSAARSKRSSLSFVLKLAPIELQLRTLKSAPQGVVGTVADCQRVSAQIEGERERLVRLVPDLPAAPALVMATAAASVQMPTPAAAPVGACSADNEQTRADLAQRFVHFMQMARVPLTAMAPYQSLGRRLSALNANMLAMPGDCNGHGAALAQANSELQQLMAMESRTASLAGSGGIDPSLDGTMPLLSSPTGEACVAELRLALREVQQDGTRLLLTTPEGSARSQAQRLVNTVVQQQVDAFGRSPLSAEACEQSRRHVGDARASVASLRSADVQAVPRPATAPQYIAVRPPPLQLPPPPPPPPAALPSQQPQAAAQPAESNPLIECMTENRRLFTELERESNKLKAVGRQSPVPDMEMANYRDGIRQPILIYCGVLNGNLNTRLMQVRAVAALPPAAPAQAPAAAAAAAPVPVATPAQGLGPPIASPARPGAAAAQAAALVRPSPVAPTPAAVATAPAPPISNQRLPVAATAASTPSPVPPPKPAQVLRTRREDAVQR